MDKTVIATPENDNERIELEALQFTLQRQDNQSKAIQNVIKTIIGVRDEMIEMKDDVKQEIQRMHDENKITRRQASKIKSAVGKRSAVLTRELFGKEVSSELFSKKSGHFTRGIYTKLGQKFDVSSYLDIRHLDFGDAVEFVKELELSSFEDYQLRITDRQAEIAEKHGDDISHLI